MAKYDEIRKILENEEKLSPGKRTQPVPCAFCTRGGNGDQSCSSGFTRRKYNKFQGCFAGTLLDHNP